MKKRITQQFRPCSAVIQDSPEPRRWQGRAAAPLRVKSSSAVPRVFAPQTLPPSVLRTAVSVQRKRPIRQEQSHKVKIHIAVSRNMETNMDLKQWHWITKMPGGGWLCAKALSGVSFFRRQTPSPPRNKSRLTHENTLQVVADRAAISC